MENKDLKTGMILVTEDNEYAIVLKDTENGDIVSGDIWQQIYKDSKVVDDLKVKKIYQPLNSISYLSTNSGFIRKNISEKKQSYIFRSPFGFSDYELIWERAQKEMTVAEIEKELGYSIKIIKEEN